MTCPAVIDDMSRPFPQAASGGRWEYIADTVMGGVSSGGMTRAEIAGRAANRLTGRVSTDNNGGFVQMALDLAGGGRCDASAFSGIVMNVRGNGETYNVHLRTDAVTRPWQSYRASFIAPGDWTELTLPFAVFAPHRLDAPFDPAALRRLGIVAIGRPFDADIAVARIAFA